jgi:hypothetical protein
MIFFDESKSNGLNPVWIWQDNCFMGIERNRDISFGFGREAALRDTFVTAAARNLSCQILLQLQYPQRRV